MDSMVPSYPNPPLAAGLKRWLFFVQNGEIDYSSQEGHRSPKGLPRFEPVKPSRATRTTTMLNKARFESLILPLLSDAYSLARSLTGNRADAEDVVQEACLRAYRAIDNVSEITARAWFLTITHNAACSWLRKNRPAGMVGVDNLDAADLSVVEQAPSSDGAEAALIAESDYAQLEAAISSLPPLFREVILLRDIQGLNYREIAEVTGAPIGTVMSRLARGREKLADLVGGRLR